ncbi:hypothetical protein ASE36_17960 [Rhizobium sp. Root274]|uniref:hypothetical protein n=1 Tax=unclassified Rhizobium TaxID=2613769 RepID=UPI00071550A4|nr:MULTISPECIES: hypothetical protein [unclassified Rhizobium]KQW27488.1 hypothetical protein ASC71_17985 [Rhizobium sp. Root1240]KRD27724.1 hypothetical protein ASE36_17960 [Rhizobium sp. Root274]
MKSITITLPEPLDTQIKSVAQENGLTLNDFFVEVTKNIVEQDEVRKKFMQRAEIGKDKVDAVLAMLRRE